MKDGCCIATVTEFVEVEEWVILISGQWCSKISTDSSREEEQEGPCWWLILIFAYFLETKETAFWPNSTIKVTTSAQCNVLFPVEEFQGFTLFFSTSYKLNVCHASKRLPTEFFYSVFTVFFVCLFVFFMYFCSFTGLCQSHFII